MLKLAEFLCACARFGEENDLPLLLVGAFALKAYGLSRMTGDLDFLTAKSRKSLWINFLEGLGFETAGQSSGFSAHLHPLGGRVDTIYVDQKTLEKLLSEAERREIFPGVSFPVPSPRHLAALKIFAVKNQPERLDREWADLAWLLKENLVSSEEIRELAERYGVREILKRLDTGFRGT